MAGRKKSLRSFQKWKVDMATDSGARKSNATSKLGKEGKTREGRVVQRPWHRREKRKRLKETDGRKCLSIKKVEKLRGKRGVLLHVPQREYHGKKLLRKPTRSRFENRSTRKGLKKGKLGK